MCSNAIMIVRYYLVQTWNHLSIVYSSVSCSILRGTHLTTHPQQLRLIFFEHQSSIIMPPLRDLNTDLLSLIFSHLETSDITSVNQVSRHWSSSVKNRVSQQNVKLKVNHIDGIHCLLAGSIFLRNARHIAIKSDCEDKDQLNLDEFNTAMNSESASDSDSESTLFAADEQDDAIQDRVFTQLISDMPQLLTLKLHEPPYNSEFIDAIQKCQLIEHLELVGTRYYENLDLKFNNYMFQLQNLKSLLLLYNNEPLKGITNISFSKLHNLYLCHTNISDIQLQVLCTGFAQDSIEQINLSLCTGFTEVGLIHLSNLKHLKLLNIELEPDTDDVSTLWLTNVAANCKALTTICLSGFKFNNNTFSQVDNLDNLRVLNIEFCSNLSRRILDRISKLGPYLMYVSFSFCDVTSAGIYKLRNCNHLVTLIVKTCRYARFCTRLLKSHIHSERLSYKMWETMTECTDLDNFLFQGTLKESYLLGTNNSTAKVSINASCFSNIRVELFQFFQMLAAHVSSD